MMTPIFVLYDVTGLPSGDVAIGGTDEYVATSVVLVPVQFEAKPVSLLLRGGRRVETTALGLVVHTALSDKRNIYLRIPKPDVSEESLRGAIVSVDFDVPT